MADELIMLDIKILPCAFIKEIFLNAWRVMIEGVEKKEGKLVMGFKVVGENRFLALFHNGSDSALKHLNAAYGNHFLVTSMRFRQFETFAKHVLGYDTSSRLVQQTGSNINNSSGKLFWVKFNIAHLGKETGMFINKWREECEFWFDLKKRGDVTLEMFKTLGQKEVHLFIRCPSCEILDDLLFTTPLSVALGNQLETTVKSVKFFSDFLNLAAN
ncbi:hypothetical protein HELRODRAFT_179690 [Helobdella robusta]|uniref:Uncharacterized protein n=1 Tax=Helobdella robusta TaxID=6412 RepID=T1FF14_HELRO|nr:hypothetical protein HELRODRAFT_179690 [Helobdella robusta]ESN95102.1 hypothetical protein HELRODRAFT_179690 [Helobdella robusta]